MSGAVDLNIPVSAETMRRFEELVEALELQTGEELDYTSVAEIMIERTMKAIA